MPAWITQRLWMSLLLCVAFLGMWRLAGRLGIGAPGARLFAADGVRAGAARLATLGQISSEYTAGRDAAVDRRSRWSAAAAGETGRVRAAARSGLAVACCGGINATATVAVLVVPFLYVLTRPRGPRRMRLLAWWAAAAAAATAWWLVPLLLLGRTGSRGSLHREGGDDHRAHRR